MAFRIVASESDVETGGKALIPEELWRMRPFPTVMNNSGFRTRHDELGLGGFGLKGRS